MLVRNRTEALKILIYVYNLKSYCEIGLQNAANNFQKIQCEVKCSVDPDPNAKAMHECTSDEFFKENEDKFSLFFIDGLHHADQVERDFDNCLKYLNEGGYIVLHDTCPTYEQYTTVPRETKIWFGDVYKFAMNLRGYKGIDFLTLNVDCGITIVWKTGEVIKPKIINYSWNDYEIYKDFLLRVKDVDKLELIGSKEWVHE